MNKKSMWKPEEKNGPLVRWLIYLYTYKLAREHEGAGFSIVGLLIYDLTFKHGESNSVADRRTTTSLVRLQLLFQLHDNTSPSGKKIASPFHLHLLFHFTPPFFFPSIFFSPLLFSSFSYFFL